MDDIEPIVSVVICTAETFDHCREAIDHWRAQTIVGRIEMVVVGPSRERMKVDEAVLEPFQGFRIVEASEVRITGHATAAGIREATAPFVIYAEEHDYPDPHLAENVMRVFDQGYNAVGWAMENANPGLVSYAHLYLQFGPSAAPVESGEVDRLVGHHTAYRKSVLLAHDHRLEDVMCKEDALHLFMRDRGERFYMCGDAVSRHVQISDLGHLMVHEWVRHRALACRRIETMGWDLGKRLLFAAGAPLIPFVRVRRALSALSRAPERRRELMPWIALVMLLAATAGAFGEALGYLLGGKTQALEKAAPVELDRFAFVSPRDARSPIVSRMGANRR